MFENETTKQHWLRIGAIALITFIAAFLAFYIVMTIMFNRISDPMYKMRNLEKLVQTQEQKMFDVEEKMMENPFMPKMRPMFVNLVKEPNEYKVIVDLKPFESSEKGIDVKIEGELLTVTGELDKQFHGNEKIINFRQTYYLDEKLDTENILKERKGDKYIITIPFKE